MKPSLPQGTRDFNALTVRKRQYILNTIKNVFELHGYDPLETPAMENLSTLTGKYGEEGDRLIFKILNNGLNEESKHAKAKEAFENVLNGKSDANLTERALRYDLTIPFARYVAMNRNDIALPYKRYQMQPVWRADRPQKGRYREFWQCDADVVGTNSLLMEAELLNIYQLAFKQLNLPIHIKVNNRKILAALAEHLGLINRLTDITIAIDKLDKIEWQGVENELLKKNFSENDIAIINQYLSIKGSNDEQLKQIKTLLGNTENGKLGIEELLQTLNYCQLLNKELNVELDFTLARGLDYYTGMICEIKAQNVSMGSIGGGGRYDNLTGVFDYPNVSGVGISFGVDRIYDVLESLEAFPDNVQQSLQYFFINFGGACEHKAIEYVQTLRSKGIAADLFPDAVKFDKQLRYANKRNYPFVCIVGENELANNTITIKNFIDGMQRSINSIDELKS
jgi:histidyl-tRNA synthetase